MKNIKYGVAFAMLLMAGVTQMPAANAADCPILIGPDWSGETLSPDPARLLSISDVYHARMVYEPFVAADSSMQPIPWLAESWTSNDKATEWTFKVREGVKFHDGSPLTAEDVVYTFRRLLDPATASPAASELGAIKPEAFQAVDADDRKSHAGDRDRRTAVDPRDQARHGGEERRVIRRHSFQAEWHRPLHAEGTQARRAQDHVQQERRTTGARVFRSRTA